jgi:hypothetical protein
MDGQLGLLAASCCEPNRERVSPRKMTYWVLIHRFLSVAEAGALTFLTSCPVFASAG